MLFFFHVAISTCEFSLTVSVASTVQGGVHQLCRHASQVQGRINSQPDGSSGRRGLLCPIADRGRNERAALGKQKLFPVAVAVAEPHPSTELSQLTVTSQTDVKQAGFQLHLRFANTLIDRLPRILKALTWIYAVFLLLLTSM